MSKLQPNFSWQKYEGKPEDQREQFQYQLQQQHIVVANAVNTTVDDLSYWNRARQTSFTWLDGQPIYTKTLSTVAWVGNVNTIPHGIAGNFRIVHMEGAISDGDLDVSNTLPLPYVGTVATGNITMARNGANVVLTSGGVDRSAYSGSVTVYYVKR